MAITIMHIHKRSLVITIIIITSSRFKRKKERNTSNNKKKNKKKIPFVIELFPIHKKNPFVTVIKYYTHT